MALIHHLDGRGPRQTPTRTAEHAEKDCPTCAGIEVVARPYAYLLGLYLGDGSITPNGGSFSLRITLVLRYPSIIEECTQAMTVMRPSSAMKIGRFMKIGCVEVRGGWAHWPCLFPQHGPGRKHERRIELVPWQEEILEAHPELLLRADPFRRLPGAESRERQSLSQIHVLEPLAGHTCDLLPGVRSVRGRLATVELEHALGGEST